ncbi:pyruvate dehydrogenase (acetyl-transferring) E1 component subunit alpha [Acidiluteibacter ferrifornacis]|jgi:pyruvate dehydrogenase E1 component subunit alpha|uniref:Pyruvate dehydrogenase E1 component subunit alpha n=1 Tax=Acidiluteibacter ferrifornacis TaxID=2692424 RepID=A0A6N9NLG4_9FLAO|nr:pyruvate dehydrogenase (acetyl-transferring) E1 component subunit alpha [Acidiluteibacter ferrifornacis]MBR9831739.1 pyruvate dehydrogenase (acetyl-transferring) E1 component subunit alpha [bacterium]NBG66080.1 pyruvate dehydrogenase (acetyl-transferring) E1 component subunit alpha [Acidiluteibacter ferrifornacis]
MAKKTTSTKSSNKNTEFSKETYLTWYESMLLMRKFEEKAGQLYIQQKIRGFCHLYIGQEALVAGAMSVIGEDDNMITAYRDHAHPIAKGVHPNVIMAELYGKVTGCSKGKGGSMHMFDKEKNFFGGHGIVGGQVPIGAGIAFADKYRGNKNVTICYMGDGAVRQGAFHEALNMAMTWKLPVIFVIENNQYAMGTSVERTSNVTNLNRLADAYDMPNEQVDGMACEPVHEAYQRAVDRARNGEGPTLLEMRTYRYKGHSMSDPAKYRTKEELEEYKSLDPIENVLAVIKEKKYATDKELKAIQDRVKAQVQESVDFSEKSEFPKAEDLYKDVYSQEDYPFVRD